MNRLTSMTITHELGFPPIGACRQSLSDQVLDMSFTLGNLPPSAADAASAPWFGTSQRYTVPAFDAATRFALDTRLLDEQLAQARAAGAEIKPVIIGPLTYLWLGTSKDGGERLDLLPRLLPVYAELLAWLAAQGLDWVQIDEPALATALDADWRAACAAAYDALAGSGIKLLLATYFGRLGDNLALACSLPVEGLHLDAVNARDEIDPALDALDALGADKVLSLGVIDGSDIWKTDLHATLAWLEPVQRRIGSRLWIAPSCSLQHVPLDLESATRAAMHAAMGADESPDPALRPWFAFALQKLEELRILAHALEHGRSQVQFELVANAAAVDRRHAALRAAA